MKIMKVLKSIYIKVITYSTVFIGAVLLFIITQFCIKPMNDNN